jgi:hypothetical protein
MLSFLFAHLTKYAPYLEIKIVSFLTCFSPKLAASIYYIYVALMGRQNRYYSYNKDVSFPKEAKVEANQKVDLCCLKYDGKY